MPVIDLYRARVAEGGLAHDPGQEQAAELLSLLEMRLEGWRPERGLFSRPGAEPRGLYLHGGVGRGKSMLMDMFFDAAPLARKRRVHFHEFMLEVHGLVAERRTRKEGDPLPPIARAIAAKTWLLCFDEMQIEDIADAMIVARLFEHLFARGVVVVATSNQPPRALYPDGLNRQLFLPFIALLEAKLDLIALDGPRDYRLERLSAAPVYHTPLGPAARAAMDQAWARLTMGARPRPLTLTVQGRTLTVARQAAGVARFSFDELCGQPLGAADFLRIAQAFQTLLLEDTPVLGPEKRNEAKRFVILIDALYERRIKLVISAAAPPEGIYPSGDGAAAFARTVSRLHEMTSRDYLAAPCKG